MNQQKVTSSVATAMMLHLLLQALRAWLVSLLSSALGVGAVAECTVLLASSLGSAAVLMLTALYLRAMVGTAPPALAPRGMFSHTFGAKALTVLGASIAGTYLTGLFFRLGHIELTPTYPTLPASKVLMFFTAVVLAPIVEEYLYRGVILGSLRPLGEGRAVLLSALLFSLTHYSLTQTLPALLAGLLLGLFVFHGAPLSAAIVLHALCNLRAYVYFLLSDALSPAVYTVLSRSIDIALLLGGMIGLYVLGKRRGSAEKATNTAEQATKSEEKLSFRLVAFCIIALAVQLLFLFD